MECVNPSCRHYSDKDREQYDKSTEHPEKKPDDPFDDKDEITDPIWRGMNSLWVDPND